MKIKLSPDDMANLADEGATAEMLVHVAYWLDGGAKDAELVSFVQAILDCEAESDAKAVAISYAADLAVQRRRYSARQSQIAKSGPKERWDYDGPVTPRLPEVEWWQLRAIILKRDEHTCNYCGAADERMCVDHVVPLSRGGSNEPDNLVACCIPCNSSKCDRLLSEWAGRNK